LDGGASGAALNLSDLL